MSSSIRNITASSRSIYSSTFTQSLTVELDEEGFGSVLGVIDRVLPPDLILLARPKLLPYVQHVVWRGQLLLFRLNGYPSYLLGLLLQLGLDEVDALVVQIPVLERFEVQQNLAHRL